MGERTCGTHILIHMHYDVHGAYAPHHKHPPLPSLPTAVELACRRCSAGGALGPPPPSSASAMGKLEEVGTGMTGGPRAMMPSRSARASTYDGVVDTLGNGLQPAVDVRRELRDYRRPKGNNALEIRPRLDIWWCCRRVDNGHRAQRRCRRCK